MSNSLQLRSILLKIMLFVAMLSAVAKVVADPNPKQAGQAKPMRLDVNVKVGVQKNSRGSGHAAAAAVKGKSALSDGYYGPQYVTWREVMPVERELEKDGLRIWYEFQDNSTIELDVERGTFTFTIMLLDLFMDLPIMLYFENPSHPMDLWTLLIHYDHMDLKDGRMLRIEWSTKNGIREQFCSTDISYHSSYPTHSMVRLRITWKLLVDSDISSLVVEMMKNGDQYAGGSGISLLCMNQSIKGFQYPLHGYHVRIASHKLPDLDKNMIFAQVFPGTIISKGGVRKMINLNPEWRMNGTIPPTLSDSE